MYDLRSTTSAPRTSEVTDTDFNDNNLPAAHFTINIVPEPSTLALLCLAAAGSGWMTYRHRKAARGARFLGALSGDEVCDSESIRGRYRIDRS
jgi:hypothetical protein